MTFLAGGEQKRAAAKKSGARRGPGSLGAGDTHLRRASYTSKYGVDSSPVQPLLSFLSCWTIVQLSDNSRWRGLTPTGLALYTALFLNSSFLPLYRYILTQTTSWLLLFPQSTSFLRPVPLWARSWGKFSRCCSSLYYRQEV